MNIKSEQEMLNFGRNFAEQIAKSQQDSPHSIVIELIGDVGTGKTTFTCGLAEGLGVKESVTSPSFTISKSYPLPESGNLIHYDFYRLSDPGLMLDDLAENLKNPQNIIVVEWGESIANILPPDRIKINIKYHDQGREITL